MRTARYSIVLTVFSWSVLSIPNLFVYRVTDGVCKYTSTTYNDYLAFFLNPILYGLLPISLLASFGYATYRNIYQVTHRLQRTRGKIEEQLTRSICLQCASFIISEVCYSSPFLWCLPYASLPSHLGPLHSVESVFDIHSSDTEKLISSRSGVVIYSTHPLVLLFELCFIVLHQSDRFESYTKPRTFLSLTARRSMSTDWQSLTSDHQHCLQIN